jgi:ribosome-binding factor A
MKHRLERVNEVIRRELGEMLAREIRFESKLATVQQVDITPDLKHAHIYVSFIGNPDEQHRDMALLHGKRSELQAALSRRVILKYTPHLHFKLDIAAERGSRVLDIMSQLPPPVLEEDLDDVESDEER